MKEYFKIFYVVNWKVGGFLRGSLNNFLFLIRVPPYGVAVGKVNSKPTTHQKTPRISRRVMKIR